MNIMPRIISLARTNLIKTSSNSTMKDVADLMLKENVGSVVITTANKEHEEILGFVDTNSILKIVAAGNNPVNMPVKDYNEIPNIGSQHEGSGCMGRN